MGFYLQDDMWEGASVLPRKQRDEVVGALAQLYFDGTEAPLKGAALAVFLTCKERVLIAKSRSEASSRPKPRANRKRNKTKSKANQNDIKRESKSSLPIKEGERDREEDTDVSSIPPNPPEGDSREFRALGFVDPDDLPSDEPGEFERFAAECIDAFNAVTGKDYRSSGGKDWLDLRRIYDSGRTVEDVRKVVAAKQEQWADSEMARFIRPSTLFGAKFEEYLNEGEGVASDESDWDFD
jgi:uncharacterized phage protein (TIGR02220 family)